MDHDRGTMGGLALPGHKLWLDHPWLGQQNEIIRCLKNLKQSRTSHNITDEVSRLDHYLMYVTKKLLNVEFCPM